VKWRCLKCSSLSTEDEIIEVNIYAYTLDEGRRNWLEFEIQPKVRFVEYLMHNGYKVTENARVKGRSGAEHRLDMSASRDDGVVTHNVAIGIEIAREQIGLDRIMGFDVKAFDSGFHDKVLIVIPELGEEARKFASYHRIRVLEPKDLDTLLAAAGQPRPEVVREPFEFESKSQLMEYLKKRGYKLREDAEVKGRSGASHKMDILATKDEGIIDHRIAIGIQQADKPLGLDKVFDFDDRAYDAGIMDKVLVAAPGLTKEATQFAQRQGMRVFEVSKLEGSGEQTSES
jgi:general secretion pathway protein E